MCGGVVCNVSANNNFESSRWYPMSKKSDAQLSMLTLDYVRKIHV